MQQKVLTPEPDEPSNPMQAFRDARSLAHLTEVDLTTPIPILGKRPDGLPPKLTSYFVLTQEDAAKGIQKLRMVLRQGSGALFGTLTTYVEQKGSLIEMSRASYDSEVRGCSAYAVRHFLAAFKDITDLSFTTDSIDFSNRAQPFADMGIPIINQKTGQPMNLDDYVAGKGIPTCNAVLDFRDADTKSLVFSNLGLSEPTKPDHLAAITAQVTMPRAEAHKIS